jgi:hypothetical protein
MLSETMAPMIIPKSCARSSQQLVASNKKWTEDGRGLQ